MELLDANQAQPRDQGADSHLLGPPSGLAYLLAPSQQAGDQPVYLFDASTGGGAVAGSLVSRGEQTR